MIPNKTGDKRYVDDAYHIIRDRGRGQGTHIGYSLHIHETRYTPKGLRKETDREKGLCKWCRLSQTCTLMPFYVNGSCCIRQDIDKSVCIYAKKIVG